MENWRELFFDKSLCSGVITPKGDGNIVVTGKLKNIRGNYHLFCCKSTRC